MKEPLWKRRIHESVKMIRKHINVLERKKKRDMKTKKYRELEQKL